MKRGRKALLFLPVGALSHRLEARLRDLRVLV